MLSVRIVWGDRVRFCMLPLRVKFASLLREVACRFALPAEAASTSLSQLQLCWCEHGDDFALDGQAAWDECLQRRGLMEKPGRLELRVKGGAVPPRRRRKPPVRVADRTKVAPSVEPAQADA